MRTAAIIGSIAAVSLGIGAALGVAAWRSATRSELPVAAVLPPSTLYYVEARDARGLIDGVGSSQAWADLRASGMLEMASDDSGKLSELADKLTELSKKIDYPLNGEAALKLLGAEAAVAISVDPKSEPHFTIVTRIDVDALAQDLLSGDLDWRALHDELNRRAELAEVEVTSEVVGDYQLSAMTDGETTVYATLLEDLLVVSDDKSAVGTAINLRVAEGQGSLHALPSFTDELARLSAAAPVRDWVNVAAMRAPPLNGTLPSGAGVDLAPVLDAIAVDAVARSIELPTHDLYQMTWTWSRESAELFKDGTSPRIRDVFPPQPLMQIEAQRLGQLVEAWEVSPIRAHLADSWLAEKWGELMADAEERVRAAVPAPLPGEDFDGLDDTTFLTKFMGHMSGTFLAATFGSDAGSTVWVRDDGKPDFLAAVRLGTDGRWIEMLTSASATAAAERVPDVDAVQGIEHAGRTIRGLQSPGSPYGFYWVAIGDLFVMGGSADALIEALDRVETGAPDPENAVTLAAAELPADHRFLFFVSPGELIELVRGALGDTPDADEVLAMTAEAQAVSSLVMTCYVADDFSQMDFRVRAPLADDEAAYGLRAMANIAQGSSRIFDLLPERSIWTYANRNDLSSVLANVRNGGLGVFGEGAMGALNEFEQRFDVDFDGQLIPSLGNEIGMALLYEAVALDEETPPIPGVLLVVAVDDRDPVIALFESLADTLAEAAIDDAGTPQFERTMRGDFAEYRLVTSDSATPVPFTPTMTFVGDFLVLALDEGSIDDLLAVQDGALRAHSATDLATRIRAAGVAVDGNEFAHVDWNLMLDQISLYATHLGNFMVDEADVPMPEFPDDGDTDEWQRRIAAYETAREAAAAEKVDDVIGMIEMCRFIDFMATTSSVKGELLEGHSVTRFQHVPR